MNKKKTTKKRPESFTKAGRQETFIQLRCTHEFRQSVKDTAYDWGLSLSRYIRFLHENAEKIDPPIGPPKKTILSGRKKK